ncbi:MAG: CotH kinase family protein [Clostridia bacterium]|nr:CotH kinase family protein [Clostridia bacterium]
MKKITKSLITLITVMILSTILLVSASAENITTFSVDADSAQSAMDRGAVKWYQAEDTYYLFLPTGTDTSDMTVWFNADADVFCNGTQLINGEKTSVFAEGTDFVLTCGATEYKLKLLVADSIGTIYLTTESGNMAAVHADKSHKEPGEITILNKDGEVQYDGVLDSIKGRGNSTWKADKKPYNIKLDEKADLFGMGKHKSWCLLSNPSDPSLIRNELCFDFARAIGLSTTTDSYQVNLYLNGEYAGVYLVTEKVDIGENRIDIYDLEGETEDVNEKDLDEYDLGGKQNSKDFGSIKYAQIPKNPDEITGGYLLETEKIYRYVNEASGFITKIGQSIVVKTPEYASKAQVEYISKYYQDFEDALYSDTGYNMKGKHYSDYIDAESLARIYILLEFTANFDGCSSSFFLYKDVGGKLTVGPAWDFDSSLSQHQSNDLINHVPDVADPELLYVQTCFIGNHAENRKSLLAQAFSHDDFHKLVEKVWAEEFEAYYPTFLEEIGNASESVRSSLVMNAIRWETLGTTKDIETINKRYTDHINEIRNYAETRYPFLQNAYKTDTYFVKYNVGANGATLVHDKTVYEQDSTAVILDAPDSNAKNLKFAYWSTEPNGLGETYKAGDEIIMTDNVNLFAHWEEPGFIERFFDSIRSLFENIFKFFTDFFGNNEQQ